MGEEKGFEQKISEIRYFGFYVDSKKCKGRENLWSFSSKTRRKSKSVSPILFSLSISLGYFFNIKTFHKHGLNIYIGARSKLWFLTSKSVLFFSCERVRVVSK